jgi:hypothetical protein
MAVGRGHAHEIPECQLAEKKQFEAPAGDLDFVVLDSGDVKGLG